MAQSFPETKTMLLQSVERGAKTAAASQASDVFLQLAQSVLGDAYPEIGKTERGQKLLKILSATVLYYICREHTIIPKRQKVANACSFVIDAAARDLVEPEMDTIKKLLLQLASLDDGIVPGEDKAAEG